MRSRWLALHYLGLIVIAISGGSVHAGEKIGNIRVSNDVSKEHLEGLRADWKALSEFRFTHAKNPDLKTLLGVSSLSSRSLTRWLEDRIQVIVGPDFNANGNFVLLSKKYSYELPDLLPKSEVPPPKPEPEPNTPPAPRPKWDMASLSAEFYNNGKSAGWLWGLKISGAGTLKLTSPRAGIIQIGPGLFDPPAKLQVFGHDSPIKMIYRMTTFFHEARHSDGNGLSAGFNHAICPEGHALAGKYACDRNLNGPYTVGANMMKAMAEEGCTTCSVAEREALRLTYLQFFDRVLPTELDGTTASGNWDAAPEGLR